MKTLLLRCEGPLQSWGERARWAPRDTAPEPTKSGIVGLLGCALGWNDDPSLRELSRALRMGVRCDRPGVPLKDFQTILRDVVDRGDGDDEESDESATTLSHRAYLADASFLVALQAEDALIERLATALRAPVWVPFLGRKACVPSLPLCEGVAEYATLEAALQGWRPWRGAQARPGKPAQTRARGVIECEPRQGARRRDAIISNRYRTFGPRWTRDVLLEIDLAASAE